MFESIRPASAPGDSCCQLSRLNTPALLDSFIAASPGRMSESPAGLACSRLAKNAFNGPARTASPDQRLPGGANWIQMAALRSAELLESAEPPRSGSK
jgi:hypothetical protein